jgi:O-ureido-D-serine cyclo-ligase
MTRHIALVTTAAARELDDDLAPLDSALRDTGAQTQIVDWDDASIDWARFDLALLRSPWDYTQRLPEFLAWAERAAALTRLVNPLPVVRWNTDKHYLRDLESAGVAIVPSTFVEPGEDPEIALEGFLQDSPLPPSAPSPASGGRNSGKSSPPSSTSRDDDLTEFVVKPAIGAGSRDAQRYGRSEIDVASAHVRRLLETGRSVLLQPYLAHVDEHGETALMFFDGSFSHAIRKGPLLKRGEGPTRALFAAEHITPRDPTPAEHALAERLLSAIPFAGPLLYARVDLIHDADGAPRLLELELTEPSLFFAHGAGSATRFAKAVLAR